MSKFHYTRFGNEGQEVKAGIDLDIVWGYALIEKEDGNVLVLQTTLEPIQQIQQAPVFKKDRKTGQQVIVEYRPTTVLQTPLIEIKVAEEIEQFMDVWV